MIESDNDKGHALLAIAFAGLAIWVVLEKIADTEKRVKKFFTKKRRIKNVFKRKKPSR